MQEIQPSYCVQLVSPHCVAVRYPKQPDYDNDWVAQHSQKGSPVVILVDILVMMTKADILLSFPLLTVVGLRNSKVAMRLCKQQRSPVTTRSARGETVNVSSNPNQSA